MTSQIKLIIFLQIRRQVECTESVSVGEIRRVDIVSFIFPCFTIAAKQSNERRNVMSAIENHGQRFLYRVVVHPD
jgi:hypothetical protein